MIHYTLLPDSEIKILRREYKTRLFIVFSLFVSVSIFIGIVSLVPSYVLSRSEEHKVIEEVQKMKKEREEKGVSAIDSEFMDIQKNIDRVLNSKIYKSPYSSIEKIISHKNSGVLIRSFNISYDDALNTKFILQGKANNRDSIIAFKKSLEADKEIKSVELPISDLAKSRDISFTIQFIISK